MRSLLVPILLVLAPTAAFAQLAASPWPMFHHDPQHTGRSPAPGITTPALKWEFQAGDSIAESSPAIGADGAIYFGCTNHRLYALGPTGALRWTYLTRNSLRYSSPAIASDGTVYIGSMDSTFYAINANGTLRWSVRGGSTFRSSPVILPNGDVAVGNGDNKLYRFTGAGAPVWAFTTGGNVRSSPAHGFNGDLYVGSFDFSMYAVTSAGTQHWKATTGNLIDLASATVGPDSTVYFGSSDGFVYAIRAGGAFGWAYTASANVNATPAIAPNGQILAPMGSRVVALNNLGQFQWVFVTRNAVRSSPAVAADGTIYFGSDDSTFYCLNPSGTLRWSWPAGSSIRTAPAIDADGTVYFGTFNGKVIALRDATTAVEPREPMSVLALSAPLPTPSRGITRLQFIAPAGTRARLDVLDLAGRHVATLWDGAGDGLQHLAIWNLIDANGSKVAPGVYLARITAAGRSESRRIVAMW
ncbi:MAG: PQQ-binding-like beta-propeller repeat protein [Candidatus Eisenbacteria bacterium]